MPLMKRFGALAESESSLVNTTLAALSALAFFVMNTRPTVVDAHSVPASDGRPFDLAEKAAGT